jgi:hypothetical protein
METIAKLPPISNVLSLGEDTFGPGTKIEAVAVYSNFSINLMKEPGFYIFQLEFRLKRDPNESEIVMNTGPASAVDGDTKEETGVRVKVPYLFERSLFINIHIYCMISEFKVKVNNRVLEERFPYRYPLDDVREIWFKVHGRDGYKLTSLKYKNF